ncbi:hypothetical protein FACS1894109_19120 [Spirochaetia bacterium]|nr:hypothetical protein FACS1894109_19120 [Spirochaetia bacterium]
MKKFMNRTTGLKALCGLIVGAAVLFAACSNPLSPSLKEGISTAPGTGQVRVSIAGEGFAPAASVRTIFPTQPAEVDLHYVYTFTKDGEAGQEKTPEAGEFTLVTGNWNLRVDAYLEAGHTNLVASGSTAAAFTVSEGGSTSVTVTLEPVTSGGTGTLTYTVTYPVTATLDSLTWEKLGGAALPDFDVTSFTDDGVTTTLSGPETPVDAGYYVLTAALSDGYKTAGKMEVVHIYQNLTTTVTGFDFTAADFTLPDITPPAEVTGLGATAENTQVVLTWTAPTDSDFAKVLITFSPAAGSVTQPITVLAGTATATISSLAYATAYTFTVKTVDTIGNTSVGTDATATTADTTYTATVDGAAYTATTTKIDFVFDGPVSGLADTDITIGGAPGTATKGTLTETDSTHWSLALTVTTLGAANVSITKDGIASGTKPITLHKALANPSAQSIADKFGIDVTTNNAAKVTEVFTELQAYLAAGPSASGSGTARKLGAIALGDYIDLADLTVVRFHTGTEAADGSDADSDTDSENGAINATNAELTGHGWLLRLIVVGINAYSGKNGNGTAPHLVFQFQNMPGTHRINETATNVGGYKDSEIRKYLAPVSGVGGNFLAGLTAAGVPESVLWAPKRIVWNGFNAGESGSSSTNMVVDTIEDKLFLPTAREMFGSQSNSDSTETTANQGRLEYYETGASGNTSRIKYNSSNTAVPYREASPYSTQEQYFCAVGNTGTTVGAVASNVGGVAPAFCVK